MQGRKTTRHSALRRWFSFTSPVDLRSQSRIGLIEQLETRWVFSPLTWSAGPALPAARDHAVAVTDYYSGVYVIAGATTVYHQSGGALGSWAASQPLQNIGTGMGAGWTSTQIVAYGGSVGGAATPDSITYDPYLGDNQDTSGMHAARRMLGSASDGAYAYAFGGLDDGNAVLRSAEYYDIAADSWTSIANMPTARFGFPVVSDDAGNFYTFGGATANNATSVSNIVYKYNIADNSWSTMAPMPTAVREAGATLALHGSGNPFIYVVGGATASGVTAAVQKYDVIANTWTVEPSLPVALKGAAAFTDINDRLEVIGGVNASNVAVTSVFVTQQLDVVDTPPTFTSTPVLKGSADKPYSYQAAATGNPLPGYSLVSPPAGMTIDATTGLVSWQPNASQVGTQNVTIRATNFAGSVDQSFAVNIVLETTPPAAPTNVHVDSVTVNSISLAWDAGTDNVGVASYNIYERRRTGWRGNTISYALVGTSTSTSATIAGLTSASSHTYAVRSVDTSGNISTNSLLATGTTYRVPTLSLYSSGTPSVAAKHPLAFSLYSSANPKATFSLVSGPATMSVDPDSGLVTWVPDVSDVGAVPATFRATNIVGSADLMISIIVRPDAPVLSYQINPGTAKAYGVANEPMTIKINDSSLTASAFTYASGPAGVTIDPDTGVATWTPTVADAGTKTLVFHAVNSAGSTDISVPVLTYFTGAPTNIVATNIAATSATINWTAPTDTSNVVGYRVTVSRRVRAGRAYTTKTLTFLTNSLATTLNVTGLTTGAICTPRVVALDVLGMAGLTGTGPAFVPQNSVSPGIPNVPPSIPPSTPLGVLPSSAPTPISVLSGVSDDVTIDSLS